MTTRGATSIAFEENQLSPSLISLSLLSTTHPLLFQQEWVRTSSQCYLTFILVMDRSPGFGSTHADLSPLSDSVSLRLPYSVKLANASNSLTHYTKGTQSHRLLYAPTACTHTVSGSISLPSPGFFSPFPHGTGSLSVSREYLALEDGPPIFRQDFTCPVLLVVSTIKLFFRYGIITLYDWIFQTILLNNSTYTNWALSLSLATT